MGQKIFKFWLRYRIYSKAMVDRYFEDYPKLHHFIEKHNIKDKDIVFIRTRKQD